VYATIVQCEIPALASADARGRIGRALANALDALPGFVAFVALDADAETATMAALCVFEEQGSIAAAERVIAQWQHEHLGDATAAARYLGAGAVIAQKGL
jgi:hypothetical protein